MRQDGGTATGSSLVWPPLPEPVEGAYVRQDGGTATGASSAVSPLPEPVEVRGGSGEIAVQPQVQVQFDVRSLSLSKGAVVKRDDGTATGSSCA